MQKGALPAGQQKIIFVVGGLVVIGLALAFMKVGGQRSPFASLTAQMDSAMKKRDFSGALAKAQQRLEIAQKSFEPNSPQVTDSLHDIGSVYAASKRFDDAKEWIERSVALEIKVRGTGSPGLADKMVSLAEVYGGLGNQEKAQAFAAKALVILESVPTDKKLRERVRALALTSRASLRAAQCDVALADSEKGLGIAHESLGKEGGLIADLAETAGRAAICVNRLDLAEDYIKEAVQLTKKQKAESVAALPSLLSLHGEILCKVGKCKQGMKLENDGYKLARKLYGEDSQEAIALIPKDTPEPKGKNKHSSRSEIDDPPATDENELSSTSATGHFDTF